MYGLVDIVSQILNPSALSVELLHQVLRWKRNKPRIGRYPMSRTTIGSESRKACLLIIFSRTFGCCCCRGRELRFVFGTHPESHWKPKQLHFSNSDYIFHQAWKCSHFNFLVLFPEFGCLCSPVQLFITSTVVWDDLTENNQLYQIVFEDIAQKDCWSTLLD